MIENNSTTLMQKVQMVGYFVACINACNTMKIQRYFGMRYNTASQIVEILERLGIVSEFDFEILGRKVLVSNIDELESKLDYYF